MKLLRLPDVKSRISLSKSTIYQRIADGQFPAPIPLGGRAVAWLENEIDLWIEQQISNHRNAEKLDAPRSVGDHKENTHE